MTVKRTWSCDICLEQFGSDRLGQLFGIRFIGMHKFKVGEARTTEGQHVCYDCIRQIVEQMGEVVRSTKQ